VGGGKRDVSPAKRGGGTVRGGGQGGPRGGVGRAPGLPAGKGREGVGGRPSPPQVLDDKCLASCLSGQPANLPLGVGALAGKVGRGRLRHGAVRQLGPTWRSRIVGTSACIPVTCVVASSTPPRRHRILFPPARP